MPADWDRSALKRQRALPFITAAVLTMILACIVMMVIASLPRLRTFIPSVFSYASAHQGETAEPTVTLPCEGIDLNSAGLEELMLLPGIGEKKAQAIIDFREQYGLFCYPEDLMLVSGIGEGIFDKLKDSICCLLP